MPSDYERIREENLHEYGHGSNHLRVFATIYPDKTHFIYELLQNAEDAGATQISFHPYPDRLEVRHNGRAFSEADVRAICSIGDGTKTHEVSAIGRFGIGFKSVYQFTNSPEIYSTDQNGQREHFRIREYVRPEGIAYQEVKSPMTTRLVLPYNHEENGPTKASPQIRQRLERLGPLVLLFLSHLERVAIETGYQAGDKYHKEETVLDAAAGLTHVRLIKEQYQTHHRLDSTEVSDWLVYKAPSGRADSATGEDEERPESWVQIAFRCRREESGEGFVPEQLPTGTNLVVYFPTSVATRLGFLIHGPYHTTPARDNLEQDSDTNRQVAGATARLLRRALNDLRDRGWLNLAVLQSLPLNAFETEEMPAGEILNVLFKEVREAFRNDPLLPTASGTWVSANQLRIARGAGVQELMSPAHLGALYDRQSPLHWLDPAVTQDKALALWGYLRTQLGVQVIDPEALVRRFTPDFLKAQPTEWFVQLYHFLLNQPALWRANRAWQTGGLLRQKRIIRLEDGGTIEPFDEHGKPLVFLTGGGEPGLPCVAADCVNDSVAREFLVALGLKEADNTARLERLVLPGYSGTGAARTAAQNQEDWLLIASVLARLGEAERRTLLARLRTIPWMYAQQATTGEFAYRSPFGIYRRTETLVWFLKQDPEAWFLVDERVPEAIRQNEHFPWSALGVVERLELRRRAPGDDGNVSLRSRHSHHERGVAGFDPNARVPGLEAALARIDPELSEFIWNEIAVRYGKSLQGIVETATRQNFSNRESRRTLSAFGQLLHDHPWLPAPDGRWVTPSELALSDLPATYERDEKVAAALRMKGDLAQLEQIAQSQGLDVASLRDWIALPTDGKAAFQQWLSTRQRAVAEPEDRPSPNPARRSEKLAELLADRPEGKREIRERSVKVDADAVRDDARGYLKMQYTQADDRLICQICREALPFKLAGGEYYFEAVKLLRDLPSVPQHEHRENHLCLCPLHAAMFQHANESCEQLAAALRDLEGHELPVRLAGEDLTIWLTSTHREDLKTILGWEGERRSG